MIVKCNCCRQVVYEFTRNISGDDYIKASQFRGINGYEDPKYGAKMLCPSCDDDLTESIRESFRRQVVDSVK